jgi:isochorismate pyruvate lyase
MVLHHAVLSQSTGFSGSVCPQQRQNGFEVRIFCRVRFSVTQKVSTYIVMSTSDLSAPSSVITLDDLVVPETCQTMAEVRVGVDELDRLLVRLLARRQRFMDAAARIKPEFAHVRDEGRVEDVVAKVLVASRAEGLSAGIAEPVWRELIEQCIAYEAEVWTARRR